MEIFFGFGIFMDMGFLIITKCWFKMTLVPMWDQWERNVYTLSQNLVFNEQVWYQLV